jgi:uncharacterized membrane protein YccC
MQPRKHLGPALGTPVATEAAVGGGYPASIAALRQVKLSPKRRHPSGSRSVRERGLRRAVACEVTGVIMANPTSKYRAELRLVIRALTAAALSLVIADALALPQSYWAVFTALIIVQGSVGGTLAAGLDRFVGTLAGAVLGAAVALTGEFWRVPQVLLLLLAVAPVALLAAIRPSFRIAPVTAAILQLTTPSNASPIISAIDRVIEIALGTIIGIVVSIFVLPSRARRIWFERSAEMLKLLAQVLVLHLQPPDPAKLEEIERFNQRVRLELAKVEATAEEARREHLIRVAEGPVPERLVRTLRRLRSDVAFVGRATAGNDFDWQGLGLVTAGQAPFASSSRPSLTRCCATPTCPTSLSGTKQLQSCRP